LEIEYLLTDDFSSHILLRNMLGTGRLTGQDPVGFRWYSSEFLPGCFSKACLLETHRPLLGCKVLIDCAAWEIEFPAFSSPY
jgi:hypothetical protein